MKSNNITKLDDKALSIIQDRLRKEGINVSDDTIVYIQNLQSQVANNAIRNNIGFRFFKLVKFEYDRARENTRSLLAELNKDRDDPNMASKVTAIRKHIKISRTRKFKNLVKAVQAIVNIPEPI